MYLLKKLLSLLRFFRMEDKTFGSFCMFVIICMVIGIPTYIPSSAFATDIMPQSTRAVAVSSRRAVVAKCILVETKRVEKYGGSIFTFSTFDVVKNLRGDINKQFTLRLLGGRIDDIIYDAPMIPFFTKGEEVIIFLGEDNKDGYPIISLQGIIQVETNVATKEKFVSSNLINDIPIYNSSSNTEYSNIPKRIPLEDMLFSLNKLLNENLSQTTRSTTTGDIQ